MSLCIAICTTCPLARVNFPERNDWRERYEPCLDSGSCHEALPVCEPTPFKDSRTRRVSRVSGARAAVTAQRKPDLESGSSPAVAIPAGLRTGGPGPGVQLDRSSVRLSCLSSNLAFWTAALGIYAVEGCVLEGGSCWAGSRDCPPRVHLGGTACWAWVSPCGFFFLATAPPDDGAIPSGPALAVCVSVP